MYPYKLLKILKKKKNRTFNFWTIYYWCRGFEPGCLEIPESAIMVIELQELKCHLCYN